MESVRSWWRRMHSEWESISRMYALSFIIICRKIWKAIIRRQDVQEETGSRQNAFFIMSRGM